MLLLYECTPPLYLVAPLPLGTRYLHSLSKAHPHQVEATESSSPRGAGGGRGGVRGAQLCRMLALPGRTEKHTALGRGWIHIGESGEGQGGSEACPHDDTHQLLHGLPISMAAPAIWLPSPVSIKEVFPGPWNRPGTFWVTVTLG